MRRVPSGGLRLVIVLGLACSGGVGARAHSIEQRHGGIPAVIRPMVSCGAICRRRQRQGRRFASGLERQLALGAVKFQLVKGVRVDEAAGQLKNPVHIAARWDPFVRMPPRQFPAKDRANVRAKVLGDVLPGLPVLLPPVFQLHDRRSNKSFPFWLHKALPLWQYANLEMRRNGYAEWVANDTAPPNRIRELREAIGMSQAELARRSNVTPSALNKVEMGRRKLDQQWMVRIAAALECTPADLLPDEQNPGRLNGPEHALIALFRAADETQRKQIFALIQALLTPEEIARLLPEAA